jgi:hypothetical protein
VPRGRLEDADTCDEADDRDFREDVDNDSNSLADLLVYKELLITVRWGDAVRPLSAYERW